MMEGIVGSPPDLRTPPPGCSFHPRVAGRRYARAVQLVLQDPSVQRLPGAAGELAETGRIRLGLGRHLVGEREVPRAGRPGPKDPWPKGP